MPVPNPTTAISRSGWIAHSAYGIQVSGASAADSVLNFTGSGTPTVAVDLGARTVQETGFAPVTFAGIATVNVNNGLHTVNVLDSAGNGTLTITPTGANSSTAQLSGLATLVDVTLAPTTLNVSLTGVNDTLAVEGSQYNDAITVTGTQVADIETSGPATTLQTIAYTGAAALAVNGNDGSNTFTVTPGATSIPISIDGGDP